MNCKHIFDPIAIVEYLEALAWYGERSDVASENFITEVEKRSPIYALRQPLTEIVIESTERLL